MQNIQPMTNSHELIGVVQEAVSLAVGGAHHVAALPPEAQAAGAAAAVATVVAARKLRPLSHDAQARVDAGGDALVERRREFFTSSWLDGHGW